MKVRKQLGIGFVTGRSNVCNIINSYYKNIIEQVEKFDKDMGITIFILFDTEYQSTKKEDFYHILPEVYNSKIKIEYITPEIIKEEREILKSKYNLSEEEIELFIGYGHAKERNALMYYAKKNKIDYLLFWDDDEYPVANIKNENKTIEWKEQDNILVHLNNIESADITIGYHCGYISPIPYMDYYSEISEEDFRDYIEAVSNDIINWESIKEKFENNNGVTFANVNVLNEKKVIEVKMTHGGKWVAGSTLCLNLNNIDKIPAFFNPPGSRGEDTFFATQLGQAKVLRVPTYHFHDGFLKYEDIMKGLYPKTLRKISIKEQNIEKRFLKASIGWIKYKPLFMYITKKETYEKNLEKVENKLIKSIPSINKIFENTDFNCVLEQFRKYHESVKRDYEDYLRTNKIWNELKNKL